MISPDPAPQAAPPLAGLFEPRGIVLVGASPDTAKLPGRPLNYLRRYGFKGAIHPVNPKYDEIDGLRCHRSVEDVPDPADLALILLSAPAVPVALEACGRRGIGFAIVIAAGFAEAGDASRQAQVADICRRYGIRCVGPNCVGVLSPKNGLTATFSTELRSRMPRPGGLVLATQSGALGNSLLQSFNDLDIALRAWISTGNEADLGVLDIVEHFLDDPDTRRIALFVEGLKDGAKLVPLARAARARGKAILALRAGRSQLGRAASVSHTGKLAGSIRVWTDVARQAGIVECATLDELLDLCLAFEVYGDAGADAAEGLGVLTISGGLGVLISDAAAVQGLPLPRFSAATQEGLRALLPPQMSVANPVDTALFADEQGYARCAELVLDDPGIGTLLLVLTSLAHDYAALAPWIEKLGRRARGQRKHVALTFLSSSDQLPRDLRQRLLAAGVLVLPTSDRIVTALGKRRAGALPASSGAMPPPPATGADFAERARIPRARAKICKTEIEAAALLREIGGAVALKIASPDIPHKTEVGGVKLGIRTESELREAWQSIEAKIRRFAPTARVEGIEVQEMIGDGVELIVGCSIDAEIGPVLMVGAGGVWAEVLEDVAFLALPATMAELRSSLRSLRIFPLLDGARGRPKMDVEAALAAIGNLAAAFKAGDEVVEVDINPLIVRPEGRGAIAVDTLIVRRDAKNLSQKEIAR